MEEASSAPTWVPGEAHVSRSRLLAAVRKWGYTDLVGLQRASVEEPEKFWRAVVEDLQVASWSRSTAYSTTPRASRGHHPPGQTRSAQANC